MISVLEHCGHNKAKAAQILGIGYNTLWRKLKKYGLSETAIRQTKPMPKAPKSRDDRLQHGIAAERDRLRAILDSMDDGIYIVGRDYRIRFMNRLLRNDVGDGEGQRPLRFFRP